MEPLQLHLLGQICPPVSGVEQGEQQREEDAGHLVDLADAVVSLHFLLLVIGRDGHVDRGRGGGLLPGLGDGLQVGRHPSDGPQGDLLPLRDAGGVGPSPPPRGVQASPALAALPPLQRRIRA